MLGLEAVACEGLVGGSGLFHPSPGVGDHTSGDLRGGSVGAAGAAADGSAFGSVLSARSTRTSVAGDACGRVGPVACVSAIRTADIACYRTIPLSLDVLLEDHRAEIEKRTGSNSHQFVKGERFEIADAVENHF